MQGYPECPVTELIRGLGSSNSNKPEVGVIDEGRVGPLPVLTDVSDNPSRSFLCRLVVVGRGHINGCRQEPSVAELPHLGRFDNESGRPPAWGVK